VGDNDQPLDSKCPHSTSKADDVSEVALKLDLRVLIIQVGRLLNGPAFITSIQVRLNVQQRRVPQFDKVPQRLRPL
jgi:hypothetical protein